MNITKKEATQALLVADFFKEKVEELLDSRHILKTAEEALQLAFGGGCGGSYNVEEHELEELIIAAATGSAEEYILTIEEGISDRSFYDPCHSFEHALKVLDETNSQEDIVAFSFFSSESVGNIYDLKSRLIEAAELVLSERKREATREEVLSDFINYCLSIKDEYEHAAKALSMEALELEEEFGRFAISGIWEGCRSLYLPSCLLDIEYLSISCGGESANFGDDWAREREALELAAACEEAPATSRRRL